MIKRPTNEEIMSSGDPDARLDTGMRVREAIDRAAIWWDKTGRRVMAKEVSSRDPNDMPSGIVAGLAWVELSRVEQISIVKVWHHFYVRKPDIIGGEDDAHKAQQRNTIN